MRRICLSIADMHLALSCDDAELNMHIAGPMREFISDAPVTPDLSIKVCWTNETLSRMNGEPGGELLFDSGSTWRLYSLADGRREFRLSAPFSGWRPYKRARFDANWTSGEILCEREHYGEGRAVYPLEYPLDEVLVSNLLACGRGVEMHACGLTDEDGRGYLFVGQSGAGKSTTARLWSGGRGVKVLSDERIILRAGEDGSIRMYGTPWHGDSQLGGPGSGPLHRIFFLDHAACNEFASVNRAEAAARLFSCAFPPFYSAQGLEFTLGFLDQLTERVQCGLLRFAPDERATDFVRALTRREG